MEYRIKEEKEKLEELKSKLLAFKCELSELEAKEIKTQQDYERIVRLFELIGEYEKRIKKENKTLKTVYKTKYVQRNALKKIVAAWVITVPAAAILSALIFFIIKGVMV